MVRFKNRYLVVETCSIDSDGRVQTPPRPLLDSNGKPSSSSTQGQTAASIAQHIRASIGVNFGQMGQAFTAQALSVKYHNGATGTSLVRVAREHVEMVWAALTFLSHHPSLANANGSANALGSTGCLWRVIHVAGTIRCAQRAVAKHTVGHLRRRLSNDAGLTLAQREAIGKMVRECTAAIACIDA